MAEEKEKDNLSDKTMKQKDKNNNEGNDSFFLNDFIYLLKIKNLIH